MIRGADRLNRRLSGMEDAGSVEVTMRVVGEATKMVQGHAKLLCSSDTGELRRNIYTDVECRDGVVYGVCYTNKAYAVYVELGTGPRGEADHDGISPAINPVYAQSPWWIHESQIDKEAAEKYGWFYIDTPDGRFYQCSGQAAQPYLYPALKDHEGDATEMIRDGIREEIRRRT